MNECVCVCVCKNKVEAHATNNCMPLSVLADNGESAIIIEINLILIESFETFSTNLNFRILMVR